ncbi:MAG: recombination directionality factor [Acidithiobacillus sp.]
MEKINTVGKIRPGIKILKRAVASNPKAIAIYNEELRKGNGFTGVDKELEKAGFRNALVPHNEEYFSVWRHEFPDPTLADRILDAYGEQRRDDPVKRLYRFPILFYHLSADEIINGSLQCFKSGGIKYWSEYKPDGTRVCMMKQKPPVNQKTQRVVRVFGGRKDVLRPENNGVCDPENCPEYQNMECSERFQILGYIPGVCKASDLLGIPTGSYYSTDHMRQVIQQVASVCGGEIPLRIQRGAQGNPLFWISKHWEEVVRIDDRGESKKQGQWLIHLDADIELALLMDIHDAFSRASNAQQAYKALAGNVVDIPHAPAAITHAPAETLETFLHPAVQEKEMVSALDEALDNRTLGAEKQHVAVVQRDSKAASGEPAARPTEREMIASLRKTAVGLCKQIGVDATLFAAYATDKFGDGWGARMDSLKLAIAELEDVITQDYAEQYADDLKSIVEDLRENA